MKDDTRRLLNAMASATGKQYVNNVLHLLEKGDQLGLSDMMTVAMKQAADDFEEWEAVPEAANYQSASVHWSQDVEDEAARIMKKAVEDFIERVINGKSDEDIELREEFRSATQRQIAKVVVHLKDFVWV